jgi:hypothetical protein
MKLPGARRCGSETVCSAGACYSNPHSGVGTALEPLSRLRLRLFLFGLTSFSGLPCDTCAPSPLGMSPHPQMTRRLARPHLRRRADPVAWTSCEAFLQSDGGCLGPIPGLELVLQVADVALNRVLGDTELQADIVVRQTPRELLEDPHLLQ